MNQSSQNISELIKAELQELDSIPVHLDGKELKASQCYHYDVDPAHILFNTNCPDHLRKQIEFILSKYL
jgi:hypothetical protein